MRVNQLLLQIQQALTGTHQLGKVLCIVNAAHQLDGITALLADQLVAGNNADQFAIIHYRQVMHIMLIHQQQGLRNPGVTAESMQLCAHDRSHRLSGIDTLGNTAAAQIVIGQDAAQLVIFNQQ